MAESKQTESKQTVEVPEYIPEHVNEYTRAEIERFGEARDPANGRTVTKAGFEAYEQARRKAAGK